VKTLAIILSVLNIVLVLITSITLYSVLNLIEPTVSYRVITSNVYDRSEALYIDEHTWAISGRYRIDSWVNIDAGTAVRIAQMLTLGGERLDEPYLVFHDEDNEIFIVIADMLNREDIIRVVICSRTGGLLLTNILGRGWMPTYMPAHVIE